MQGHRPLLTSIFIPTNWRRISIHFYQQLFQRCQHRTTDEQPLEGGGGSGHCGGRRRRRDHESGKWHEQSKQMSGLDISSRPRSRICSWNLMLKTRDKLRVRNWNESIFLQSGQKYRIIFSATWNDITIAVTVTNIVPFFIRFYICSADSNLSSMRRSGSTSRSTSNNKFNLSSPGTRTTRTSWIWQFAWKT